jgi:predicted permease
LDALFADLRYGLRLWRKAPGFAAVAVITLALGIGANTAIFSVVNALLLLPLPYAEPDRVVMVWEDLRLLGFPRNTPAPGNYSEWVRLNRAFSGMAAIRGSTVSLTGDGAPEQILGSGVTPNFFSVLGVPPLLGRAFTEEEDRASAKVVVISYGLWQRRYAGDRAIVGKPLLLDTVRYDVIGVMPRNFVFRNRDVDYWVPMAWSPEFAATRTSHFLNVVARLAPGTTIQAARADMRRVDEEVQRLYPDTNKNLASVIVPLREDLIGDRQVELLALMAAAVAVLLIACANLASLLMTRALGRRGEMAVRAALGATRSRLMTQMIVEATSLSVAGGALGLALAPLGVKIVAQLTPLGFGTRSTSIVDGRLLAFTIGLSFLTGFAFSLVPALQVARSSLRDAIQQSAKGAIGHQGRLTRDAMVVAQTAAALVLLVSAGLMLRTLAKLHAIPLGFRTDHLLTMRTTLPQAKYSDTTKRLAFYDRVIAETRALPGVVEAAYGSTLPFMSIGNTTWFGVDGQPVPEPADRFDGLNRQANGEYLKALGATTIEGRLLDERDGTNAPLSVVVNETLARQFFPGSSAVGRRLWISDPAKPSFTIVGVVRDVHERGYQLAMKPGFYRNAAQIQDLPYLAYLVVRTRSHPQDLAEPVRRIIGRIDPDQPISAVRTMDDIVDLDVADRQQQMVLLGVFAALALLLASVGLYGVLSFVVTQRSRELGLRMALGASAGSVLRLVLLRGLSLAAVGIAVGIALAVAVTRALQHLLYGVEATDAMTFSGVVALLAMVAIVASYLPAQRAARLDPIAVLRD